MDKRPFTCCFTGHRNLPEALEEEIWRRVYACLELLLEEGVRYFGVGGALGFDTMVAEKLLALRESSRFPIWRTNRNTSLLPLLRWILS